MFSKIGPSKLSVAKWWIHKTQFSNYGKDVDLYAPGHKITIADSGHKNDYMITSGTSLATPMVSAILATYISYEHITKNASKVVERLKQNWHEDFLQYATPNIFVHSGLEHPARKRGCPYNGYPRPCNAVENTKKMSMYSLLSEVNKVANL